MKNNSAAESWPPSDPGTGKRSSPSCLEASMPRKFRDGALRAAGTTVAGLNWAMCALCLASFTVSGVLFYRELGLESRIASLEARCVRVQGPDPPDYHLPLTMESMDALVQRVKTDMLEQMQQPQRIEPGAVFRPKRDISECNCPPGKSTTPRHYSPPSSVVHAGILLTAWQRSTFPPQRTQLVKC
jgi:hypothetical protein